jgi:hypothetical protein
MSDMELSFGLASLLSMLSFCPFGMGICALCHTVYWKCVTLLYRGSQLRVCLEFQRKLVLELLNNAGIVEILGEISACSFVFRIVVSC